MGSRKKIIAWTLIFGALAGGTWWPTVRPSGYGCGPSLGLLWGLLWVLLMWWKSKEAPFPSQALYILLAFIIGFSIAGTQGYGQFNQWITGKFYLDSEVNAWVPIHPFYGFYHLFICGLTWGGFPALLISWIIGGKKGLRPWIKRIVVGILGLVVSYALFTVPDMFLPLYAEGYYADLLSCPDCLRTIETAQNTYSYLAIFLFLAVYTMIKNKQSSKIIVPIALGFAFTFSFGGILHRGEYIPGLESMPWWKLWEFTCGFGGGLSIIIAFWVTERSGSLDRYIEKSKRGGQQDYWWGFWLPFYIATGELARDRIHQVAKLYYKLYSIDFRSEFFYLEIAAIGITVLLCLRRLLIFRKNEENLHTLHVHRPKWLFLAVYIGYFLLILPRWIVIPLNFENNVISLLTITACLFSLVMFGLISKFEKGEIL